MTSSCARFGVIGVAMLVWAGCNQAPSRPAGGVIVAHDGVLRVGAQVPDVAFVDRAGKTHRLSSMYRDAAIIAFVEGDCAKPIPALAEAGRSLKGRVSVVEICMGPCESSESCVVRREDEGGYAAYLCDKDQVLARLRGASEGECVILVDRSGVVVDRGAVADLARLTDRARQLASSAMVARARLYGGN